MYAGLTLIALGYNFSVSWQPFVLYKDFPELKTPCMSGPFCCPLACPRV